MKDAPSLFGRLSTIRPSAPLSSGESVAAPMARPPPAVAAFYHAASRTVQERFDTRRIADRLVEVTVGSEIDEGMAGWIQARDMFFLSTVDPNGQPSVSYKGGDPGFVRVLDPKTIAWPNYDGNGMYLSMGNIAATRKVGLLFIDFERPNRVRVHGDATLHYDDPLLETFPEAQFIVRLRVEAVFPNCPRYIHHMKLLERSKFVPKEGCQTPVPGWKQAPWARDALPKNDPARKAPAAADE